MIARIYAYWPAWVTLILSVLIVLILAGQRESQLQHDERRRTEAELASLRTRLEATVVSTFNPTIALAAMVQLDGDVSAERFNALASQVLKPLHHIKSFVAAPDDVIRHVHPLTGNEKALNLDYRRIPAQWVQVQQARAQGEPLIVAPVKLVQGGLGVIQRTPVFLRGPGTDTRRYWGVISLVADLERFAAAAGLAGHQSLEVALFEAAPSGAIVGKPIWGPTELAENSPVVQLVQLPGARWALLARPLGGWTSHGAWGQPDVIGAIAAGVLLTCSAWMLARRRIELQARNRDLSRQVEQSRQVQAELERSRGRLKSVAALGSDWLWEQDANLRFSYISEVAGEDTGVRGQDPTLTVDNARVIGHLRWELPGLLPGPDWEAHRAMLARHEPFRDFEYQQLSVNGEVRHVNISGVPLFDADGNFVGYRGIGRNVTLARRAEAALLESQGAAAQALGRLQAVLDAAIEVSIIMTDLEGKVVLFNRGAERMLGYREAEMLGHVPLKVHLRSEIEQRQRELSAELGRPAAVEDCFVAIPLRDGSETRVWTYRRKDGNTLAVSVTITRVQSRNGDLLGYLGIARDISEQLQAQADLRESNALLETRVSLRTAELSAALQHLRQTQDELLRSEKMAALGSLVAGVAHELNTPLGNCLTTASTLEERTRETLKAFTEDKLRRSALADYLHDAATGAGILLRSLGTANELVAHFKQLSVDQTSTQRRQFDLSSTLGDVLSLLRPRLRKTPYRIDCQVELERELDSYPGPLGQVINNLVLNALLHAFEGRDHGQLTIRAHALDDDMLQLVIEDDGVGMTDDVRRRAFDPFFTTKMGSGGTGLGLNIVYNIVTGILGGHIELTSAPGKGSRFVFRIPFVAPQLTPRATGPGTLPQGPGAAGT